MGNAKQFGLLIYVLLVILLESCNNIGQNKSQRIVTLSIPQNNGYGDGDFYSYKCTKNLRRELNLKNLELGVDSFEFRIYENAFWVPRRLFIIKLEDSIWTSTIITYFDHLPHKGERNFNRDDDFTKVVVDSFTCNSVNSKCSWKQLSDSLKNLEIWLLPTQRDIPKFKDRVNDGIDYYFEIATKNKYKFFTYHNPEVYADKYNKKVLDILNLVSNEITPIEIDKWDKHSP